MNDTDKVMLIALRRDARAASASAAAVTDRIEEMLGGPPASTTQQLKAEREAKFAELVAHGEAMARLLLDCHAHLGVQTYESEDIRLRERIMPMVKLWRRALNEDRTTKGVTQ